MSYTAQWSSSPAPAPAPAPARDREYYNECLARFKPCHVIRASSPSPATPFTTASPTPAPSLVKESRPGHTASPCTPLPLGSAAASSAKIPPFRTSPASSHIPTANVPPFFQDLSKAPPVTSKASPLIQESSAATPLKSAHPFFRDSPPKGPATLRVPPFLQGDPSRTSPDKGTSPFAYQDLLPATHQAPAVLVPFYQEASSSSSPTRKSASPRPVTPPKKAASPPFQLVCNAATIPIVSNTAATTRTCRSAWFGPRPTATAAAVAAPPIAEEEDHAISAEEEASPPPPGPCQEEEESSEEIATGCLSSLLSTTGRSQSKGGYSRMWEDPVGERHAIPLYNRLHFSTLPSRKSASSSAAAVTKKTWYLVHNTYASLQNSSNGHHHPHHHHSPHHATHTFTNGAVRMEEVGGGDEFRSHNHAERLMRKMETCATKRQLCDVVLIAGPKRLPAHRLVLSAASDYFAAMFMNNVREATMEEVELKDVDPEALASLVQYTYTGRIELKEETVECLLSTACLLQLSEVVEACCSFLMKQLHPSNCIGIRQFADAQGCTDLYKVANNYVMEMFVEVMHNSEFLMLPWEEVGRLLASDDLNVPNEETIFEALIHWAKHDLTARRKNLSKLLAHIKLPLMAPQYIADHVETNSLFRDDRECQQLIMEALKYHLLPERRSSFQSPRTKPRKSTVGVLYAVGGMDCTKGATSIEKYELRTNTWTQVANMSGRRLQFGVAVLEDRLYVVGGRDGLKTLNTVECYDPKKKTWTLMPPMSTHRHGLGVGVLEGPMYAVGGHDGWSYLNTVERWDPQARQWSYVAPMSTARSTVGVASLHGKLYAVGGRDGSSCLKSVECFDPHTNKWTHCTPMAKRRGGVGVATCNGFLYAVGGHEAPATNPTCSRYDSAERYDPKTDQWTNISPISSPRDAVGLCPLGDKLFAVGGYDGQQYLNDVECYDPITNEWVKVASLCTGRAGACVVHVPNS